MKSLLESIFGGRTSVTNNVKSTLDIGWPEIINKYKNATSVEWHAEIKNHDNILYMLYDDGDDIRIQCEVMDMDKISAILALWTSKKDLELKIIDIDTPDKDTAFDIIMKTFRQHPDIFLPENTKALKKWRGGRYSKYEKYTISWSEFKKRFETK